MATIEFDFAALRRFPDVEEPNLFAVDASDRLILNEAATSLSVSAPGEVVVLGDHYGALTLGASGAHGARDVRVFQDSIISERALAFNCADQTDFVNLPLGQALLEHATVVLLQLPRSLNELDEWARAIARYADPRVVVYAGGRIKHMTLTMNEVLGRHFGAVRVSRAHQKSRVLIATLPLPTAAPEYPREFHADLGIWVYASGAVFSGTRIDIGTRALLNVIDKAAPDATSAVDLGCGSGVLGAVLAKARPSVAVLATDVSAAAVASARATASANALSNLRVEQDDAAGTVPDSSVDLVLMNPPFHVGSTVQTATARRMFAETARILKAGGELWTVFNSHLGYRGELERVVGETIQVARNKKFTVTMSRARGN